jgi:signal transduction histidine kinase
LTKPLLTLRKAAARLGQGHMEERIPVHGKDEIAFLGSTMEEMRQAILQRDEQQKAMLAGVAHELRNPLGGIELFAGLLADDAADDTARQRAQRILNETRNLKTLVQDFLEYARPISPKPQWCAISACWNESIELVKSQSKSIEFSLTGDAQVWMDPQHLKQILLNLALNAVHAVADAGRVTCTVHAQEGRCFVDVADTGKGIPESIRNKIFEPFFSSKEKGLGLGLAMVRLLTEANKGSVQLLRSDGTGTCFRLELLSAL